jgi:hypothetical protein
VARGQEPVIVRYLAHEAIDRRYKPWAPLLVHHPICKLTLMIKVGELPKFDLTSKTLEVRFFAPFYEIFHFGGRLKERKATDTLHNRSRKCLCKIIQFSREKKEIQCGPTFK